MKKIFIALTAVCAGWILSGCEDKLNIQQHSVTAIENFYKTDADAESALVNVYYTAGRFLSNSMYLESGWNECPLLNPWEYASDDIFSAGENKADGVEGNQINAFWLDASQVTVTGSYQAYYMIINACNLVIDHFKDATSDTAKRCVAEARVMRAYMHFLLGVGWGTPPIVDHVLGANERPGNSASQQAVLQFVVDDCDAAISSGALKFKTSKEDKNKTIIITREFAKAVKAKALMFMNNYDDALTELSDIIGTNMYELVPSNEMTSLYHYSGRGNKESVFELNLKYDASVNDYYWRAQPNFIQLWGWRFSKINKPNGPGSELAQAKDGWGWCNPSKKFVDALIANDGVNSARRKAWIKSYEEVLYDMPYQSDIYEIDFTTGALKKDANGDFIPRTTPITDAEKQKDPTRGVKAGDGVYGNCGWFMWKRMFREEDYAANGETQWNLVVMRYAEVLLMYAECCAQTNTNVADGLDKLKLVQNRAQAAHVSTSLTLAEVQKEKYLECWLEGTRFMDLVRWGIADVELANNGKYLPNLVDTKIEADAPQYQKDAQGNYVLDANGEKIKIRDAVHDSPHGMVIDESDAAWCVNAHPGMGFKKGKHELFPFPFKELNVNPNLKQNPGY